MRNKKISTYNDGVVSVYREKERLSNFSARQNASAIDDLEFIVKLAFEESAKREQDLQFAEQNGFELSCKIKTRNVNGVDNKCKAIIDGYLYDVSYIDKTRTELFWYLQGVKAIDS